MQRVLVVDDENDFREIILDILTGENFQAYAASNGLDAIDIFRNNPVDVVLLDLRMPSLDGMETMLQLKKINPGIPVVILTAFGDIPAAVEAVKKGAYDFIAKPPDFDKLISVVRKAAELHDTRKRLVPELSVREVEILKWLKEGKSSYDIGNILDISSNTVNFHIKNLFKKLNTVNRTQAVSEALRMGIITDEGY